MFLVAAIYAATRMHEAVPPALDLSRSKLSERGSFTVSIAPEGDEPTIGPLHGWILTVVRADGTPVDDATVSIGGGMPDHDHGLPTQPQVTAALGQGRYRVEGVKFTMGGHWELIFDIVTPRGSDEVAFNLVL